MGGVTGVESVIIVKPLLIDLPSLPDASAGLSPVH
jgi:hypothetical protein